MANFDCYVRIYLPLDANGRPKTSDYGHYDLMIKSMGNTPLNFDSHTSVVDPVFSYGGSNNGQGYVKIFNPNKTVNIFTFDMLACTFHFTASSDKVGAFVTQMQKVLTYSSKDSNASTYKVNSNWDYKTYTTARNNSFGAVAAWCAALGDSGLLNIHNSSAAKSNYMTCATWAMYKQYYAAWAHCLLIR